MLFKLGISIFLTNNELKGNSIIDTKYGGIIRLIHGIYIDGKESNRG